ncbi:MAG: DEAD/DEAH box helicase [Gammaproteobacteria bacterium]|nr:DEAD/DEAH box helicase [Gammaproteobacteria bacterium]
MSFNSLGLSAELLRAVSEKGYGEPTPIQIKAIPVILEGRDILAGAQTGTGKTAGFALPLLQRLSAQPPVVQRAVRALILTPTRELAAQVEESVRNYGKHLSLKSTVVFGGVGFTPQADTLRRGVDILVATPGRLLDHVQQKTVDLSHVEILVLDEADRMLDMGFIRDIRKILALLPKKRQNLLFSATFSDEIKQLSDTLLNSPVLIEVARRNTAAELVTQVSHPVDRERKRELLSHLIHSQGWKQVLVFMRTKHGSNRLADQLQKDGITSAAIHGNKSQGARTKALADFKKGTVRVLVATDIAARGLDIDQLPHVVNFELPNVPEDYVHRIGRTGRAGNEGEAVSLVCVDEHGLLRDIERVLKREIPKLTVAGFEPNPAIKAEPITRGRGQRGGARPQAKRQGADRGRDHRPRSHAPGRSGGEHRAHAAPKRPSNPHAQTAGDRRPHAGAEVDGNRRGVDTHMGRDPGRGAPGRAHRPAAHARPAPHHSPTRKRFDREVPALLGGNKRDE